MAKHTYIHTYRQTNLQLVNSVFAYHFGQKTWPWPSKWEIRRFFGNPEIPISTAGTTFFDKNVKKTSKKQMKVSVYVCMYVCMFAHAGRGNMTKTAHTYIHTWADAVSKRVDFFMYVYFCPCRPRKRAHPYIHTFQTYITKAPIHTYIHPHKQTYNSSIRFLHRFFTPPQN